MEPLEASALPRFDVALASDRPDGDCDWDV